MEDSVVQVFGLSGHNGKSGNKDIGAKINTGRPICRRWALSLMLWGVVWNLWGVSGRGLGLARHVLGGMLGPSPFLHLYLLPAKR